MSSAPLTAPVALVLGIGIVCLLVAARFRPHPHPRRPTPGPASGRAHARAGPAVGRPRVRSARAIRAVGVAVMLAVAVSLGALSAVGVAGSLAIWPAIDRRRRTRAHRRAVTAAMPEALDLMIVSIEAGHLPLEALRLLHPVLPPVIGAAFAEVVARVDRGERLAFALAALPERLGPATLTFVDALVHTERAGLAFGPAVQRLADDAREHRRRLADAAARELPVRLSFPLVLCTLPSFVLVAIVPLLVGALSSIRVR